MKSKGRVGPGQDCIPRHVASDNFFGEGKKLFGEGKRNDWGKHLLSLLYIGLSSNVG